MFITFEGIEGVGKTTHLNFVANFLRQQGVPLIITREPGGTEIGEEIRDILLKHRNESVSSMTELLLMFAARTEHIHRVIQPALKAKQWVICDRFTDATYAYQGGGRKMPLAEIEMLEHFALADFHPDFTLIFDAPATLGLKRIEGRATHPDRFERENVAFFERVREVYLLRAKSNPERYRVIDATRSLEEIQKELIEIISGFQINGFPK